MRPLLLLFAVMLLAAGCSDRKPDLAQYAWRYESLRTSGMIARVGLETISYSFEERLREPESNARASRWLAKKLLVDSLCKSALADIGRYIPRPGFSEADTAFPLKTFAEGARAPLLPAASREQLNRLLSATHTKVLAVDSIVNENFGAGNVAAGSRSQRERERLLLPPVSFANNYEALLALQQLDNAWRQFNLRVATFFHEQTSHLVLHCLDYDFAIVNQNAAVLQPGGRLQIEAGVGKITTRPQPHVFVAGMEVPLSENGMAQWHRKVSRPGRYSVPVRVSFLDEDGKEQVVTKTVTYEVLSCASDSTLHK